MNPFNHKPEQPPRPQRTAEEMNAELTPKELLSFMYVELYLIEETE